MNARLISAETALAEGRRDDALADFAAALTEEPTQPASVYLQFTRQLYRAGRHAEGERWAAQGVVRYAGAAELWHIRGVFLRTLRRRPEALAALDRAIALKPDDTNARINRANLLLDMSDGAGAVAAFAGLVAEAPGDATLHFHLARALAASGRSDLAADSFRRALAIEPTNLEIWRQFARVVNASRGLGEAEAVLDEGLAANADAQPLLEARALLLRAAGAPGRTEAYLQGLVERYPDQAWIHFHLGDLVVTADRPRGLAHLWRALALAPDDLDHMLSLIQALETSRGPEEATELEQANALAQRALALGAAGPVHTKILSDAFSRVCDFDGLDALGDFKTLGRNWAGAGMAAALMRQLPRVSSAADRVEIFEQHRLWGRSAEARAAAAPVDRRPRGPRTRIRLGIMSSDLCNHVVARFAQPVFDHIDRERFDVYAYSFFQGEQDAVQARIAGQVTEFRWRPDMPTRAAAQMIADDSLDMLIEIGGLTKMNKPEVMAYRPAPLQASWLGYPHSLGLSTIDKLICDRLSAPTDRTLMVEEPLMLPKSWKALRPAYADDAPIAETSAEDRQGFLTFGTANGAYKYTRTSLRTWAKVVARVPGSRFVFIRPEAASPAFRQHVLAQFALEGAGEDRVIFHAVRGAHLPFYDQMDIALDTFPLTGGTTTVDSLWMGVPVVSLTGEAFFERQSYSILSNVGLGDLCASSIEGYIDTAVALAADQDRRAALRATLRQTLKASPLGQSQAWARDFYDALAGTVESHSPRRSPADVVSG